MKRLKTNLEIKISFSVPKDYRFSKTSYQVQQSSGQMILLGAKLLTECTTGASVQLGRC